MLELDPAMMVLFMLSVSIELTRLVTFEAKWESSDWEQTDGSLWWSIDAG